MAGGRSTIIAIIALGVSLYALRRASERVTFDVRVTADPNATIDTT